MYVKINLLLFLSHALYNYMLFSICRRNYYIEEKFIASRFPRYNVSCDKILITQLKISTITNI